MCSPKNNQAIDEIVAVFKKHIPMSVPKYNKTWSKKKLHMFAHKVAT